MKTFYDVFNSIQFLVYCMVNFLNKKKGAALALVLTERGNARLNSFLDVVRGRFLKQKLNVLLWRFF